MITLTKQDQDFKAVEFCTKALNKGKDAHKISNVVLIEGQIIVGTDGYKLYSFGLQTPTTPGIYDFKFKKGSKEVILTSSHSVGSYPDWKAVIPEHTQDNITVTRKDILHRLKFMAVMVDKQYKGIKINLLNGLMRFNVINPNIGDGETSLKVNYNGQGLEIGIDCQYFIKTLNRFKDKIVNIGFNGNSKPVVITGNQNNQCLALIMPMRI